MKRERSIVGQSVKTVLLGSSNVGKTSLVEKFVFDSFQENQPNTIGAAYCEKGVSVNGKNIRLQLWDTGGQERYRAMSSLYYRDAKVAILCYDITDRRTLDGVQFWISDLQHHEPNCSIYLCATKIDLLSDNNNSDSPREFGVIKVPVSKEDIELIVRNFDIPDQLHETSSKTGAGIGELFTTIATDMSNKLVDIEISGNRFSIKPSEEEDGEGGKGRKRCC